MNSAWLPAAVLVVATLAMRLAGPLYLGRRKLPERVERVIVLIPPPLLAALVAVQTFSTGQHLVLDQRLIGLGAGAVVVALRGPLPLVVAAAAIATALARALF
jgi:uncharacterized membrane protein